MAQKKELGREQKRQLALDLYLNTDYTQKQICAIVGWSEKSFSDNKEKGKWEELKGAQTITAQKIIRNLHVRAYELSEQGKFNADEMSKIAKSIEIFSDKRVTISSTINVFKEFTTWAFTRNPELAKQINILQQEFIQDKLNGIAQ